MTYTILDFLFLLMLAVTLLSLLAASAHKGRSRALELQEGYLREELATARLDRDEAQQERDEVRRRESLHIRECSLLLAECQWLRGMKDVSGELDATDIVAAAERILA